MQSSLENNISYVKIEEKSFLRYKLIEITGVGDVEEHFTFIHPNYGMGKY